MIIRFLIKKLAYSLIVCIILFFVQTANSQIPTINYDFKTNKLDSILPFDQRFNIQLMNVRGVLDTLSVSFIQVPNTKKVLNKRVKFEGKKKKIKDVMAIITNDNLLSYSKDPQLVAGYAFDTIQNYISVPFQLKHNRDYLVRVTGKQFMDLSDSEKRVLRSKLISEINLLLSHLIENIYNVTNGREINEMLAIFQSNADRIIKETNCNYTYSLPESERLKLFINYQVPFVEFYKAYSNARKNYIVGYSEENKSAFNDIDWEAAKLNSADEIIVSFLNDSTLLSNEQIDTYVKILTDNINQVLQYRDAMVSVSGEFVEKVFVELITRENSIAPTYHNSLTENASLYYTLDLGYIYSYYIDDFFPTITLTVYPRPINPNVPFNHYSRWDKVFTRTNLVVGTTIASVNAVGKREGIIGDKALIVGIGYRFLPFAKASVGSFIIKAEDSNPIIEDYKTKFSWYVGISIDFNVANTIKSTFNNNY